jgi:hypothetical protein
MLQAMADVSFDDWFEYTIGPPVMDITAPLTAALAIRSRHVWMEGFSLGFISTLALAMW